MAAAQTVVTASWDRNTDSYTSGYRVYYGTSSGNYQWSVDAGNQVSVPITLTAGNVYYFTVRGYNGSFEYGPASNEATINLSTQAPPTAQITATLQNNNTALVTWQTTNAASATINGTAVALTGSTTIAVSAQTTFTLVARSSDNRTATASATVTPTAPAPTAQITATMQNSSTALVTWQTTNAASATINGTAVGLSGSTSVPVTAQTTFTLVARAADNRTATASATVSPTNTPAPTAQITATLRNGTATVTWQTTNATSASINGTTVGLTGSSSISVSATTTFTLTARAADGRTATASATVTVGSSTAPGVPRSMTATVSETLATLNWQPPSTGGTPTHYLVYVGTSPGASNLVNAYNVGNTLRVQGNLSRGTYYARVRAVNDAGTSLNSNEATIQIGRRLGTPTAFRLQWVGTTVVISWTAPSADTAEDVPTNYVVEAGTSPGTKDAAVMRVGNVTSISANVTTGTYYVRVRAENPYGESDPTEDLEVRAPGSPLNPTGLVNYGTGSVVDLRWQSAGGHAATGFIIEAGSASGLSDLATLEVGNVRQFVTNAPRGVYYVRVRALNARGRSGPSNEIRIIKE